MIIGDNREQVIKNIKQAIARQDWDAKVEVDDPVLSLAKRQKLVKSFWEQQTHYKGKINNRIGHLVFSTLMHSLTSSTAFTGLENLTNLPQGGAIITVNHFNQIDSLPIKNLASKSHHDLKIVIEDTNLKLPGILCYLMNYVGTIPLIESPNYIGKEFPRHLHDALIQNKWILIYPEQEMWWNYRKPRPLHRGAYYFAAQQNVPVISTFIEIKTIDKLEKNHPNFYQTQYVVHVLPTIYPNFQLDVNENSKQMLAIDYQQKITAYEKIYQRKFTPNFTPWDIAGWRYNYKSDQAYN
ncbi:MULTISPECIES: lysophospholipid acyltransferase family protein [unclassified Lactobacillus]|uniref:lysophospholipid acyltransferase family protein n=1 Tax=unclassified Lactobacillus TaxID=2620435 RepID=UPI000EFDA938|nr:MULTISPECIES: lysophospholipid acyltransferase family protein [unclassified Lactobacillus]RMC26005.1 1-acyl-sn-glycerol-3-phosphate acyltransferase [Lactobacillus sp. ESL0247]RMC29698.1 1-acyl-sn-glycerol-3-phosphate acyltransferase [Lactobacillus sp. ESL0246]RMC34103.1 1-acyl-sn-glycerol-3-phosphate acyltransferase [Lactobacillus sp. ESL0245]